MDKDKFQKPKCVSISVQKHNIRKKYFQFIKKDIEGTDLKMELELQHSSKSKKFVVELEYIEANKIPKIFIDAEQFPEDKLEEIPHKYGIKNRKGKKYVEVCLYYKKEWNRTMNISDTIIPWLIEWLYFYDMWLITGKWCGGGKHPTKKDIKKHDKNLEEND